MTKDFLLLFRRTYGFAEDSVAGTFFIPGIDAGEKLVNMFLGRNRKVDVCDLKIEERRFDIPLDIDTDLFESAVLQMNSPAVTTSTVEFEDLDSGEWISISTDLYIVPQFVSRADKAPVRFANKYLEVIANFKKFSGEVTVEYGADLQLSFHGSVDLVTLGSILAQSNRQLTGLMPGRPRGSAAN